MKGYKQGTNPQKEIQEMQRSSALCIKKLHFARLVKDVIPLQWRIMKMENEVETGILG